MSHLTREIQVQRATARALAGVRSKLVVYQQNLFSHFKHREATLEDASLVEAFMALEQIQICSFYGGSGQEF